MSETPLVDMKDQAANVLLAMGLFVDREDLPIWGARSIGAAIDRTERQAYRLIETGALPVTKISGTYVTTLRRLRTMWERPSGTATAAPYTDDAQNVEAAA
jgi:hypothetical protein